MMDSEKWDKFLKDVQELGEAVQESMAEYHADAEKWWDSLPKERQLMAFYCVSKRQHHALSQGLSYRGTLYGVFGFAPDSYAIGMECGYFNIHNACTLGTPKQDSENTQDS
jgi:hypothetical protein